MASKICPKCSLEKPFSEFHKHKGKKFDLAIWCKKCACENTRRYFKSVPKETLLEKKREWQSKNREHLNSYNDMIRRKYPDRHAARQKLRQTLKTKASPPWLTEGHKSDIQKLYTLAKKLGDLCGVKYHVDHIVPIKGENICGLHVPWNLQILESKINIKKSNKENYKCGLTIQQT